MLTAENIISRLNDNMGGTPFYIHPLKIKNIYLFGSRVYGTADSESDYDIIMVANQVSEHFEHNIDELNIHIITPDVFKSELFGLYMNKLECIFAPDFAKIQEKVKYNDANFKIKPEALRYKAMSQSFESFKKCKWFFSGGDIHRASKSLFHSFRILEFACQILEDGKIYDFAKMNDILGDIRVDMKPLGDPWDVWPGIKEKYLPRKIELENRLNKLIQL